MVDTDPRVIDGRVSGTMLGAPRAVVTVTITAVDSAPVLATNTGASLNEGAAVVIDTAKLQATDVDTPAAERIYTLGTATTKGQLYVDRNANNVTDTGEVLTVDGGNQIWGDQWTIPRPDYFGGPAG